MRRFVKASGEACRPRNCPRLMASTCVLVIVSVPTVAITFSTGAAGATSEAGTGAAGTCPNAEMDNTLNATAAAAHTLNFDIIESLSAIEKKGRERATYERKRRGIQRRDFSGRQAGATHSDGIRENWTPQKSHAKPKWMRFRRGTIVLSGTPPALSNTAESVSSVASPQRSIKPRMRFRQGHIAAILIKR